MQKGIVQFFSVEKGYGYIRIPETREEIFVQQKYLREPIEKGDAVRFQLRENKWGLYAAEVRKITS